jgi:ABC-type antimicrobial peptide transport system permease subunit
MWAVYPVTVVTMLVAMEGGYRYVKAKHRTTPPQSDAGLGAISGATLGMLAFLLAFVVGFGVNVYGERRALVLDEANAIRSTYLRAGYLVEPYRTESRDLLSEYVDWRLAAAQDPQKLDQALTRSEEIHGELWALAETVVIEVDKSDTISAYVDALNQVITLHAERVVKALQVRIPPLILWGMYAISLATMFLVGMLSGYAPNRSLIGLVLLTLVLAVVLYLIVDLDRSQEGLLRVSQQPLIDLQSQLPTLP